MSSQYEGEQPDGADPLSQFDAFRARQADDRAQQETHTGYSFPPEYAADPTTVFPVAEVAQSPANGYPPPSSRGRLRSVLIFAGAVVLAVGVGFGAYAAFGNSDPATTNLSTTDGAPAVPAATPSGPAAGKHGRSVDVRVVIDSITNDAFTGHLVADGQQVTVQLTQSTRFGTEAHPFDRSRLTVGETVLVRGRRVTGDTITAAAVVAGDAHSGDGGNGGDS